ncbi:hypothetical protein D3C80_1521780 [compost metagenome]
MLRGRSVDRSARLAHVSLALLAHASSFALRLHTSIYALSISRSGQYITSNVAATMECAPIVGMSSIRPEIANWDRSLPSEKEEYFLSILKSLL